MRFTETKFWRLFLFPCVLMLYAGLLVAIISIYSYLTAYVALSTFSEKIWLYESSQECFINSTNIVARKKSNDYLLD
jgi:hypothetical protein